MTETLLSPKIDFVFKALFGQERNQSLLLSLLNAVMGRTEGELLSEVRVLNPELVKDREEGKSVTLDVRATDQRGRLFDVEIQCQNHPLFSERLVYYWSRLCAGQLKKGEGYDKLHPVISIVFTDFALFNEFEAYHTCWMWREVELGGLLTELGQIHIIELSKFEPGETQENDGLDRWAQFLKEGDQMIPETIKKWGDPDLERAYEELERLSHKPEMRLEYESRLRELKDHISGLELSYKEGLEEGERLGLEKGERLGLEKGARRLLARGMEVAEVAELIGLSEEEVRAIQIQMERENNTAKS